MDNNPLKQYFRRPALYMKLPSNGKGYPEGSLEVSNTGELAVYPMTAIDEITVKTPDALFNGNAVYELIKSCIPGIKNPWKIQVTDLDACLVAIKAASGDAEMELTSVCPNCDESNVYGVNLSVLLQGLKGANFDNTLDIHELKIKFRSLTFAETNDNNMKQFEIQKKLTSISEITNEDDRNTKTALLVEEINELTMRILSSTIEYIDTPTGPVSEQEFIKDFLINCDKKTFNKIRDTNALIREASQIKPLDITCTSCGHVYKQSFELNVTDFFD